jgi:methylglutaconyl-CoA hydratase
MSDQSRIKTRFEGGIATISLARPEKHNAFDDIMIQELTEALERFCEKEDLRILLIESQGRCFCAGADLDWMQRMATCSEQENEADATALAKLLFTLKSFPVPTIARVQGSAMGGGLGLIACCDIAIAAEHSYFCLSEVTLGLVPATIAPYVIAMIGERQARRYFLSAERIQAKTAEQIGLISHTVAIQDLDDSLYALCQQLLRGAPKAQHQCKQLIKQCVSGSIDKEPIDDRLIHHTSQLIARVRASDEAQEGLSAFFERRPAKWTVAAATPQQNQRLETEKRASDDER